ncbi:hypothetical protein Rhal01_02236 [Rubritalea halochordaticola]|uniref:N-acetyltransferase domain-containing protein n=1 Tax=Rubritalea halochordaticola TaxID=714537 RepID=A0ABP9V246_9BACT
MNKTFIRDVSTDDLEKLLRIEQACFETDRLSRRSFQRWITGTNSILRVIEHDGLLVGYALVLLHRGTRLARLYSIAISHPARGQGLGKKLLQDVEEAAAKQDRFFMRLEVSDNNQAARQLYQSTGYAPFEEIHDYYEDHSDAVRMQKRIRHPDLEHIPNRVSWYQQTTDFTCGPAALMMAMASIRPDIGFTQELELDLWREATTIYMTSGHGGCHPLGLALAAHRRHYHPRVLLSHKCPLFLDGVRSEHKKDIMQTVHHHFLQQAKDKDIPIHYQRITNATLEQHLQAGAAICILISSYRLNGDKAPHWVVITASDSLCFYLHDPDVEKLTRSPLDCQYIPVAKNEFAKMINYGSKRFHSAVILEPQK